MKRIIRLLVMLLVISSLAGITSSCAVFSTSHSQKLAPYKHKEPLPKRYIINNGNNPIVK